MITLQYLTDINGNGLTSTLNSGKQSLDVNLTGGSTGFADESAWTAGSSLFDPIGGVFNDSATALTSGQQGTARSTANRALHVNLRNASGTEMGVLAANALFVHGTDGTNSQTYTAAGEALVKNDLNFSATATITQAAVTNSNTTILASNANRKGFILWNGTNKTVYVAFGATATTAAYTMQLAVGAEFETPVGQTFTGVINGITQAAATGNMQVTELT